MTLTGGSLNCNNDVDGSLISVVNGGTSPYSHDWLLNGFSVSSDANPVNLGAGMYVLELTDFNGCQIIDSVEITEPLVLSLSGASVSSSCGNSNGEVTVVASGGTVIGNYVYSWFDIGGGFPGSSVGSGNSNETGLPSGSYHVVVVDDNGCTDSIAIPVSDNNGPTASWVTVDVLCFGDSTGEIDLTVSGSSPFTFSWSGPNGFNSSDEDLVGLKSGSYTIEVTDFNGCINTKNINILGPSDGLSLASNTTDLSCYGNSSGEISVLINGGSSPFQTSWSGPNGFSSTNQDIFNLESGFYSLTILDDSLCSNSFVYFVDLLIAGCTDPTANNFDPIATVDDSTCCFLNFYDDNITICLGDSVELLYSGSINNVDSYLWSTGDSVSSIFVSPSVNASYWLTQTTNGFSCSDTINVFVSCLEFSPAVSVALSNLNCGLTDLIISVSQDSNEVDMDSAIFLSDAGSFTISSMNVGDNIGTASMGFGNFNFI